MSIEKLETYSTSSMDGRYCVRHPNAEDFMDKINEIIDYIESLAELLEKRGELM